MIDAKKIAKKLKGEAENGPKNYYLNKSLVKEFEGICTKQGIKPSNVVEELMKIYAESYKDSAPKVLKPKKRK